MKSPNHLLLLCMLTVLAYQSCQPRYIPQRNDKVEPIECACKRSLEEGILRVRRIDLVDESGGLVARLGSIPRNELNVVSAEEDVKYTTGASAGLAFFDSSGKTVVELKSRHAPHTVYGGQLTLRSEMEHLAVLKTLKHGAALHLVNPDNQGSELWVSPNVALFCTDPDVMTDLGCDRQRDSLWSSFYAA